MIPAFIATTQPKEKRDLLTLLCLKRPDKVAVEAQTPVAAWMDAAVRAWYLVRDTGVEFREFAFARDKHRPFPGFDLPEPPPYYLTTTELPEWDPTDELGAWDPTEAEWDDPADDDGLTDAERADLAAEWDPTDDDDYHDAYAPENWADLRGAAAQGALPDLPVVTPEAMPDDLFVVEDEGERLAAVVLAPPPRTRKPCSRLLRVGLPSRPGLRWSTSLWRDSRPVTR